MPRKRRRVHLSRSDEQKLIAERSAGHARTKGGPAIAATMHPAAGRFDDGQLSSSQVLGLQEAAGNRSVSRMLANTIQRRKNKTEFVGGESSEAYSLQGPGDTGFIAAGEGGYAERMQGTTVELAGSIAASAKGLKMQNVKPVLGHFNKHMAIANWEAQWFEKQKSKFAPGSVTEHWEQRRAYSADMAEKFQADKDNEQANFEAYNSFVPSGNGLITQLARVSAQQTILGIKDDSAMIEALTKGMNDAMVVGRGAKDAFAKNKDDEQIEAPRATTSVAGSLETLRASAQTMDAAYVGFQQILINQEIEDLEKSGADERARMKEINDVKQFLQNVGKTIEFARGPLMGAPEKIANAVNNPLGAIPGADDILGVAADFVYYKEVEKLTTILDNIKMRIENKNAAKEFRRLLEVTKTYRATVVAFANAARDVQRALHDRRNEYLQLGLRMDRFAQDDPASIAAGRSPGKGGDRYATMMALVVELRQAVAMAQFAKDGMPPLSGGEAGGEGGEATGSTKAQEWASWASGVIKRRDGYASFVPYNARNEKINMPEDERAALESVYASLATSDKVAQATIDQYGPLDKQAGTLMTALGGMREV